MTVLVLCVLGNPTSTEAHGGGGIVGKLFIEQESKGLLTRVGIDPNGLIQGQDIQLDAALISNVESRNWTFVSYDAIRITDRQRGTVVNEKTVERGDASGPAIFIYQFKQSGFHDLTISFLQNENVIAESTLPLAVSGTLGLSQIIGNVLTYIQAWAGLLILFLPGMLLLVKHTSLAPQT